MRFVKLLLRRRTVSLTPYLRIISLGVIIAAAFAFLSQLASAHLDPLNTFPPFVETAPQGLGDRQNSYMWSMLWWKDKLYVGTGRSILCVQHAIGHLYYPLISSYPPNDPDIECTTSPQDLPLQGEIWRWTPETETWELLFQSQEDVEIPEHPGSFVARDIGFRSMVVFIEPDGTEALYVGGVSSNAFNIGVPPARILRSTDGETFEPLPQEPGTFLGDIEATSFRSLKVYNGRLYVIASVGFAGFGPVLEAENPAAGNDNFRLALPEEITAFEIETYDGLLYIGTGGNAFAAPPSPNAPPFSVFKTDASGTPPYATTPVIAAGGYRPFLRSRSVVSMHVFKDQLYVGTDRPAELYRINSDDSWHLIVGMPRLTPDGLKLPWSGMGAGFDNSNNIHIWRMQSHGDQLYVGTMDQSTKWRTVPLLGQWLRPTMGFDLYTTSNGRHFVMVTRTGFDDLFDVGVRTFVTTPYGLIFGTANQYYGAKIWREDFDIGGPTANRFVTYLPLVLKNLPGGVPPGELVLGSPEELEVENINGDAVLTWKYLPNVTRFHVIRSDFVPNSQLQLPNLGLDALIPGPFEEIGSTDQRSFVDSTTRPDMVYHYYVLAEAATGMVSGPSNLARFPSLAPAVTLQNPND